MKTSALNRISTVALAALAEDVIKASKEGKHIISEISPLLSALEQEYNTYKDAFVKQTYSGKGKELAKLDEERDDVFSQMRNYLKAFSEAKFVPHHEEAKELYEILKQHDLGLDRKSYAEETALLKKLIESLNDPNNQSKLRAVGLDMTYEELKRKQMDFERLYSEQIEANAELRMEKSASALRKDLENTLRNYLKYIDAMKSVPNYKELYYELNELLKKERV